MHNTLLKIGGVFFEKMCKQVVFVIDGKEFYSYWHWSMLPSLCKWLKDYFWYAGSLSWKLGPTSKDLHRPPDGQHVFPPGFPDYSRCPRLGKCDSMGVNSSIFLNINFLEVWKEMLEVILFMDAPYVEKKGQPNVTETIISTSWRHSRRRKETIKRLFVCSSKHYSPRTVIDESKQRKRGCRTPFSCMHNT